MSRAKTTPEYRPVKDAHKTLGLWSIRRALTFAFTAAVVLLVAAWFLLSLLLGSPSHAKPKPLQTKDLLDLLKLVFALVAGVGALVALVTAYRRQRVDEAAGERAERVQAHVEYGQGVELLGHDRAAVRLGGLYSLERLAQDHPYYRQTVTDVVCSYLRMPFTVSPSGQDDQSEQPADHAAQGPELQVRLTAQRLLKRHLTITDPDQQPATYWDSIHIDLTGARLIDFNFRNCHPTSATFAKAHFSGEAGFVGAKFSGDAWFNTAEFSGDAEFGGAEFSETAWFEGAEFSGDAKFDEAKFSGNAEFLGAMFSEYTYFDRAEFSGDANFEGAEFRGGTRFGDAEFNGDAEFGEAEFGQHTWFGGAKFSGDAKFGEAEFAQEPNFVEAKASYPNENHVWPSPWQVEEAASGMARLTRER